MEGLKRLPEQNRIREENAKYVNNLLEELPGISPMKTDERETKKAYFNFSFRYNKETFKNVPVQKFRDALTKELGIDAEPSYESLNKCSLYVPLTKPARHNLNIEHWQYLNPSRFELPVCEKIYNEESICLHHKVLMGGKDDMDMLVYAIKKLYENANELI